MTLNYQYWLDTRLEQAKHDAIFGVEYADADQLTDEFWEREDRLTDFTPVSGRLRLARHTPVPALLPSPVGGCRFVSLAPPSARPAAVGPGNHPNPERA